MKCEEKITQIELTNFKLGLNFEGREDHNQRTEDIGRVGMYVLSWFNNSIMVAGLVDHNVSHYKWYIS